jgi:hypothetical protein
MIAGFAGTATSSAFRFLGAHERGIPVILVIQAGVPKLAILAGDDTPGRANPLEKVPYSA